MDLINSRPLPDRPSDTRTTLIVDLLRSAVCSEPRDATTEPLAALDSLSSTIPLPDAPPPPEPVQVVPLWMDNGILVVGLSGNPTPAQLREIEAAYDVSVRFVRSTEPGIRQAMDLRRTEG
jgi:hypothetical protein